MTIKDVGISGLSRFTLNPYLVNSDLVQASDQRLLGRLGALGYLDDNFIYPAGDAVDALFLRDDARGVVSGFCSVGMAAMETRLLSEGGGRLTRLAPAWSREALVARRAALIEANAGRRLAEMEAAGQNAHFLQRHGAGTTRAEQYRRSTTGLTPEGTQLSPADASRFFSNHAQLMAATRAQTLYRSTARNSFTFNMDMPMGEGYLVGGGSLLQTTRVTAVFRGGRLYTLYPKLGR